jgi:hypothetical protein
VRHGGVVWGGGVGVQGCGGGGLSLLCCIHLTARNSPPNLLSTPSIAQQQSKRTRLA